MQLQTIQKKIPVNLIIGHLGSGKTTAIQHLLNHKPKQEKWAVIVNEFGEVSIDHALLDSVAGENDYIKEIPGGCICCTSGLELQLVLTQIIIGQKPDRIIIEPTGAGHPAGIIDTLTKGFGKLIELQAVIGLFDPEYILKNNLLTHPFILDQANLSDVLLLSKADQASGKNKAMLDEWAEQLYPQKQLIRTIENGEIDTVLLNIKSTRVPLSFTQHKHTLLQPQTPIKETETPNPQKNKPICFINKGFNKIGIGWIFHPDDMFDYKKLLYFLNTIHAPIRTKGIFNTNYGKISYNRLQDTSPKISETVYRKDSRLEILFAEGTQHDVATLEKELLECVIVG